MQGYHSCITVIHVQIGLLRESLKTHGRWADTVIVFASDHGYHLGEHSLWSKVSLFEECARVPMIVRVPGYIQEGTQTERLVELVDLMPTLSELSGVEPPGGLQGQSFAALLDGPQGVGKEVAYTAVSRGRVQLENTEQTEHAAKS